MIRFALVCDQDHEFDGWFRSGEDFDTQAKRGLVGCPACGSNKVHKALMAPSVKTGGKRRDVALAATPEQRAMLSKLKSLAEKVRANSDYVGEKFAEEARKIHFGEADARSIYGEATGEEARSLIEDGVDFLPLPTFPEDRN